MGYNQRASAISIKPVWETTGGRDPRGVGIETHPAYLRMIAAMPPFISSSFTHEQLRWMALTSTPTPSAHMVAYRASIRILFKRYYLTVFFGEESRSQQRLRSEGQLSFYRRLLAYYLALSCVAAAILFGGLLVLYVIKSIVGIDLIEGHSFLHGFFY